MTNPQPLTPKDRDQEAQGLLRFDGWGAFNDTFDPVRIWTFLRAVPRLDIPAGAKLLEVAPGARGSHVLEDDGEPLWEGKRWQVREGKEALTELEDWETAQLFGGEVPPWPLVGDTLRRIREALADLLPAGKAAFTDATTCAAEMMRYMAAEAAERPALEADFPLFERYQALTRTDRWFGVVLYADRDVDGTAIRAGDFIAARWWEAAKDPAGVRANVFPVPRSQLAAAEAAIESQALREIGIVAQPSWGNRSPMARIRAKLRKPQRPTWSDRTSPLLVVRPIAEHVSEPVVAATDDAALFELLHQVGGRMPTEGRGTR
ncbi:MAG TPA: hypothetical protein VLH75_20545 [Longimicrobiales bacterium]|nr:hypothetical protein [Longimicrobiales bacterium]